MICLSAIVLLLFKEIVNHWTSGAVLSLNQASEGIAVYDIGKVGRVTFAVCLFSSVHDRIGDTFSGENLAGVLNRFSKKWR
jgi:hypothetical protein